MTEERPETDLKSLEPRAQQLVAGSFSMPYVAQQILAQGRPNLFLGNSSAIRAFDTWTFGSKARQQRIFANRGVSGIEGLLATAIGIAKASRDPVDVVLGDVSMIHDLNSIFLLAEQNLPLRVFCLNNYGGAIFSKLPIGRYPAVKDPFIATPHQFNFQGVCASAGVKYHQVVAKKDFHRLLEEPVVAPCFLELIIPTEVDLALFDQIKSVTGEPK